MDAHNAGPLITFSENRDRKVSKGNKLKVTGAMLPATHSPCISAMEQLG